MRTRTILFALVGLVVTATVAGVVVLKSIDVNRFRGLIAEEAEKATGRKLVIAGNLGLSISLSPSVVAQDVSFANAAWGTRPQMAKVKRFEAEVALLPLLNGQVKVERFVLIEPDIFLETDAKGRGNWEFEKAAAPVRADSTPAVTVKGDDAPSVAPSALPSMAVTHIRIEKAHFTWRDGVTGKEDSVVLDRFTANAKDFASPIALALGGTVAGIPLDVKGSIGAINTLLANESFPLKLTVKAAGPKLNAELNIDGSIAQPTLSRGIDLRVVLTANDVRAIVDSGDALPPIKLSTHVTDVKGAYALADLVGAVGKSDIKGTVTIAPTPGPLLVTADLSSSLFDLTEMLPTVSNKKGAPEKESSKKGAMPEKKKSDRLFSDEPLPLAGLKAADANIHIKVARLVVRGSTIQDAEAKVLLKGGRLTVDGLKAGVGGGSVTAQTSLDPISDGSAALKMTVNATGVDLGRVLKDMGVTDLLSGGPIETKISLAGRGGSVRALMASLNGSSLISLGKGKVNNKAVDLAGADLLNELLAGANPLAKKEEYTELKCGVVNVVIKDGLIFSDNTIAVETGKMNVVGSGTINLKNEELDLAVRPSPREGVGISAGSVAKLMRLRGTLGSPQLGVDEAGVAKTVASVGAAVATGGLSVLGEALVDKATADDAPCQTALGKKAPASAKSTGKDTGKKTSSGKGAKNNGENIGSALKGLLGR